LIIQFFEVGAVEVDDDLLVLRLQRL